MTGPCTTHVAVGMGDGVKVGVMVGLGVMVAVAVGGRVGVNVGVGVFTVKNGTPIVPQPPESKVNPRKKRRTSRETFINSS